MTLAPVDYLRALPRSLLLATLNRLEATHGPEAVASLRYAFDFLARPAQRLPPPDESWAVCLITGEYGSGKTWMAVQLFLREILEGRSTLPRIICATDAALEGTIIQGASGILKWLPPHIPRTWFSSRGHAGELTINGVKVACLSAEAPGQAIGEGSDLDLRDDVAKWVIQCGSEGAQQAWAAASKSCREGQGRAIVPTTPDGAEFIRSLMSGERRRVKRIDLGAVENNRGNLAPNFVDHVVHDLRDAGLWDLSASPSPFALTDFPSLRLDICPPLVELAVAIDPAKSSGPKACEVGIVGGGRDARSTVHVRQDRSANLDGGYNGWPKVAWDLAEELIREHFGIDNLHTDPRWLAGEVAFHFVIESNTGTSPPMDLLRAEERARRLRLDLSEISFATITQIKSTRDKCARARMPANVAAQGQVRLARGLGTLEGQMRNLTPDGTSTDRADAAVHLVNDLAGLSNEKEVKRVADEEAEIANANAQVLLVAEMNAAMAARRNGHKPDAEPGPMKIEGVPYGDARSPIQPRAVGALPSWRTRGVL